MFVSHFIFLRDYISMDLIIELCFMKYSIPAATIYGAIQCVKFSGASLSGRFTGKLEII